MIRLLSSLLAALAVVVFPGKLWAQDLTGDWIGTLSAPGGELRLLLTIEEDDDAGFSAVLESLDQAPGQKIPVTTVSISPDALSFQISAIGARFEGNWNADTDGYEGEFNQGLNLPLTMRRADRIEAHFVEGLDGVWETTLVRAESTLRLVLNIETTEHGTTASLDSIDQGAYGIPVSGLDRDGVNVGFQVPMANVTFAGELNQNAASITGNWVRPGFPDAQLTFQRTAQTVAPLHRPQEPIAPFPYTVEEVVFDNREAGDVRLAGTLTLPEGPGPFPAAVLLSGSGPQDRDESVWEHRPFAVLADHLTRQGIAVLRFDDRGFAESTGDFASATISDFASDAEAAFAYLQAHPATNAQATGLIGHSEGGIHAPLAAQGNPEIAFIILLAAPGTTGADLLYDQTQLIMAANGADDASLDTLGSTIRRLQSVLMAAGSPDEARTALDAVLTPADMMSMGNPPDMRDLLIQQMTRQWYLDLLAYDPEPVLADVQQPVLAMNGTLDLQVPYHQNLSGIREALSANPDVTIHALDDHNHLFQRAQTGTISEYAQIEETFAPDALDLISDWILERF